MKQERQQGGKFASKSDEPRQVRSIRLTDKVWERLGEIASTQDVTRADLIEEAVESGLFDTKPQYSNVLGQVEALVDEVLDDETVTRKGKDKGAVKRSLQALLERLRSV